MAKSLGCRVTDAMPIEVSFKPTIWPNMFKDEKTISIAVRMLLLQ